MNTAQTAIDYDLGGATYDVVGNFSRHYSTPDFTGPYDADWQLDDMEIYLDFEQIDQAEFNNIYVLHHKKHITIISHMEEMLREEL